MVTIEELMGEISVDYCVCCDGDGGGGGGGSGVGSGGGRRGGR